MSAKSDAFEREIVVMVKNHIAESLVEGRYCFWCEDIGCSWNRQC